MRNNACIENGNFLQSFELPHSVNLLTAQNGITCSSSRSRQSRPVSSPSYPEQRKADFSVNGCGVPIRRITFASRLAVKRADIWLSLRLKFVGGSALGITLLR